jgi:putative transcriptional regulator
MFVIAHTSSRLCDKQVFMVTLQLKNFLGVHSQYWLAKKTGLCHTTIGVLMSPRSQKISYDTLDKLCDAFNCTPGDLLVKSTRRPKKKKGRPHSVPEEK